MSEAPSLEHLRSEPSSVLEVAPRPPSGECSVCKNYYPFLIFDGTCANGICRNCIVKLPTNQCPVCRVAYPRPGDPTTIISPESGSVVLIPEQGSARTGEPLPVAVPDRFTVVTSLSQRQLKRRTIIGIGMVGACISTGATAYAVNYPTAGHIWLTIFAWIFSIVTLSYAISL
jgi:hypothetical protein